MLDNDDINFTADLGAHHRQPVQAAYPVPNYTEKDPEKNSIDKDGLADVGYKTHPEEGRIREAGQGESSRREGRMPDESDGKEAANLTVPDTPG